MEKIAPTAAALDSFSDSNESSTQEGYVLNAQISNIDHSLKTTRDGLVILCPQPSDRDNDPLNWTQWRKNVILLVVSLTAFLPDFGGAIGAVALIPQALEWHKTQDEVLRSLVGNIFLIGAGGLVVVVLMAYFGRLPILFWFTLFAFWTSAFCTGARNLQQYEVARVLNGLFSTVAQGGGLIFINDIFFAHEHARKINVWSFFIIISPYLGPLVTAFIIQKNSWRWAFGLCTLISVMCLVGVVCFGEETYYDRKLSSNSQPLSKSRVQRLIGVEQFRSRHLRKSFAAALYRPIDAILKPVVFISTIYYLFIFAWVVGSNLTLSIFLQPLYGFGPRQIGFFYFAPIIATVLGEVLGHWLHDLIANFCARRNNGIYEPEARLWVLWIATPFMTAGLISLGFSLEYGYHYLITALTWCLYVFGIMVATVGMNAYVLDSYPEGSGEVSAWLNFARTTGGVFVTEFEVRWAQKVGPRATFGTQGGIVAGSFLLVIVLQLWGKRLRQWAGEMKSVKN